MAHQQRHAYNTKERPKNSWKTLSRLFSYISQQKGFVFIIGLLVVINIASSLASSYMLRPIINDYIIPGNTEGLSRMLIILSIIYIVGIFAVLLQYRILNKVGQRTVASLRQELFDKMEMLSIKYFDTHQHGEIMSRYTNDIDRVSDVLTESLAGLISSLLMLIGTLTLMIYISPVLTAITLIIIPIMILLAKVIIRKSRFYFKQQQANLGETNGYIEEMITGQKTVRLFNHEKTVEDEFSNYNAQLRQSSEKAQLYSGMMMPLMQNMNTLNFVIITIAGSLLVIFRGFDLGGLVAFIQYSRQFGRPINELANQYNTMQAAIAGAERIFEVIDETPEIEQTEDFKNKASDRIKGNVIFKDVVFGYNPDIPVLKGISLYAESGKKIALVGSTGAGKTTIFNMLPRFYDYQEGEILIDGVSIREIDKQYLRNSIGMVLQDTHLFTGTVMENIRYGRLDATDEEVIQTAKLVTAHSFIKRLPHGYNTLLTEDGSNLSQGQRQLLNIARAAISNPAILLLDEATSDVDTRTEILIQKGMDKLMEGRTSFVIAHRLSTVKNADEILVLENGNIIERGSHSELIELEGRYFTLYQNQFK